MVFYEKFIALLFKSPIGGFDLMSACRPNIWRTFSHEKLATRPDKAKERYPNVKDDTSRKIDEGRHRHAGLAAGLLHDR